MVGCTDFSEDIQAVDKKVDDLTSSTQTELTNLKSAVAALEAKLDAQYATKEEVAALKSTLENSIAEEVAALNGDIAKVNAALQTAQEQISAAIADLDDKKADKTAVDAAIKTATEAIEKLNSDLQAVKGELEGKIAAAQATLEEQIAAVDAKAMENYNTLVALSEYLEGLEAKVDEINNTLLSLSEYLPEMKAELEGKIADVDAKAIENYNTLVSLSEHLEEYEATTDMKLVELQGSLAALSAYLEEYEASVDAKFKEILGTFESLSLFLDEKFAALEDTDTDLYGEIDGLREAFTNLNNLLEDEVKARQAADEELYNKISEETQAKVEELQQMFTNLNNLLEDEAAARQEADNEIYAEMENIRTYVGQVYNALSLEIQTVADGLKAHIAAFEAYKATIEEALKELSEEDAAIRGELGSAVLNLTNLIEDLQKEDEAIYAEIDGVREALTQLKNALELQISEAKAEAIAAAKKDALEKFNMLTTVIVAAEDRLNDKIEHAMQLMAALDGRVATLEEQAASMQAAIDELNVAVEALQEMDQAILAEIESLKAEDKAIKAELKAARKELQEQIDALVAAKEALEARVSVLEQLVADNADAIADNRENIEANIDAISEAAKALGRLEGTVNAFMQSSAAADAALSEVDAKLQAAIDAAAAELASAVGRIAAVEDAVKALQELAATLASKEYVDAATADLEYKIKFHYDAIAAQLDAYVLQLTIGNAQNAADITSLKSAVAEANAAIAALEGRVDNIEIDIDALEDAVKEIYDALDALKAENAQQASTIQGLKDLCSVYLNMIGANKDENTKQSKQIAEILVAIEDLKNELGDIAEWQTFVNTTLNQLSNQIYEAIGLAETQLKKDIEEAVSKLKEEDAKIREEIKAGLEEYLNLAIKNDDGVMDHVRAFEEKMSKIVAEFRGQINELLARVQSIVLVPEYNDGKATIHFASLDGYPIIGPSVLKYRVQAVKGEDAASISEALVNAWKNNPDALQYHVVPVKERTRNAQPEATLNIENVTAEKDFIYVTVRPADFDAAFYTSVMEQKSNVEALVDGLFSRTTSYSAAIIFTDGVNNVTSEYYNLYPEATEVTMKIVIPDEEGSVKDITNVFPGEERQKLAYTDVETSKAILAGHDLLFTVNSEDYTKDALVKEFGYDINIIHTTVADYNGEGFDEQTIVLPYGVRGETFPYAVTNGKDARLTIYPGMDCTVKLAEPLPKEHVGNVMTVTYTYTVNEAVSVQTSSEVEITHEIVNVTFDEVTIPWSLKLANELRGGEDKDFAPYYKSYTTDAIKHDCPYDLGTMLTSMSKAGKLEKVIKVNGEKVGEYVTIPRTDYDDANCTARIKFQSGSPKFSAEGPTKYEIVYHGIYNNQYDVTATAIVVFEQIPSFEITSDVTLASQKGWFVGDDALVKDGILDKNLAADLGYETAADALNQLYAAYTDAATTKATEITFGGKTIKGSRGNGNVQLNVTENHDLTKVYLYNGDVEELLGKAQLEDDSVFAIKHTITTWTGAKVVYNINAKADLPDYVLDVDPMRVKNGVVEVEGEIENEVYSVNASDLAKYYYVFNENTRELVAPKTNVPALEVKFELKGQDKAEGYYINDKETLPVLFENKGLLEMGQAVVNWGSYPHTEIDVIATLYANGYPIDSKPITLVTEDPLKITFDNVNVNVEHKAGTSHEPIVAKIYQNFNFTSSVEPEAGNLCNVEAWTLAGLFYKSHADKTYDIKVTAEKIQVYYIDDNNNEVTWDAGKVVLGEFTDSNATETYKVGDFDGNIYITPDDGKLTRPLYVRVGVNVSHRIHSAAPTCLSTGVITVTFNPVN